MLLKSYVYTDVDAGEIERLKCRKMELEDEISALDKDIKAHQSKIRHVEDEKAKLEKERVSGKFVICLFLC